MAGNDYSLNYGKAIGLQGQPKLAVQIALEREKRNSMIEQQDKVRADQQAAAASKRKQDQFKVLESEITIKDPSKYHRWYLGDAIKAKQDLLHKLYDAYDSGDWTNASNAIRDHLGEYEQGQAVRQQESAKRFEEMKLNPATTAFDTEYQKLLRTGTIDDGIAYVKAMRGLKGVDHKDDEQTGVPLFSVQTAKNIDLNADAQGFTDPKNFKENYQVIPSTKPNSISNGVMYYNDKAVPRSERVSAWQEANLGDPAYVFNTMVKTPSEQLFATDVDNSRPESITNYVRGQLDNKALSFRPITQPREVKEPHAPTSKSSHFDLNGGTFQNSDYIVTTNKQPDGSVNVKVDPNRTLAEELRNQKWRTRNGTVDGTLVEYNYKPDGSVRNIVIDKSPAQIKSELDQLDTKYDRIEEKNPTKYRDEKGNTIKIPINTKTGKPGLSPIQLRNFHTEKAEIQRKTLEVPVENNIHNIEGGIFRGKITAGDLFKSANGSNQKTRTRTPGQVKGSDKARISIRRKSDGKTGTILESDFNDAIYERL